MRCDCLRGSFISSGLRGVCCCLVAKSCPTLCDPVDCSPPGSSCLQDFPARILEWVSISFSKGSSWPGGWAGELRTYFFALSLCSHFSDLHFLERKENCPLHFWNLVKSRDFCVCPLATLVPPFSPSRLLSEEATSGFLLKLILPCGKAQVFHLLFELNDSEHSDGGHGFSMTSLHCPVRSSLLSPAVPWNSEEPTILEGNLLSSNPWPPGWKETRTDGLSFLTCSSRMKLWHSGWQSVPEKIRK